MSAPHVRLEQRVEVHPQHPPGCRNGRPSTYTLNARIVDAAGFAHNFWIGTDDELMVSNGATDIGIRDWDSGVEELEWVVPEEPMGLRFGCTVPGHCILMQGDFTLTPWRFHDAVRLGPSGARAPDPAHARCALVVDEGAGLNRSGS